MNLNQVALSGNLTREPELKSTASGLLVLTYSIAVNERVKRGDEWEDYANFVNCVSYANKAESLSKVLHKGTKVALQGKLHFSKWEDDSGKTHSKLEVYPSVVDVLSSSKSSAESNYTQKDETSSQTASQSFYDDEIPF